MVGFAALPAGAPNMRSIMTSDLRGAYAIASAARDDRGCYPSYLFDLTSETAKKIEPCLISANRNALTPVNRVVDGAALAAFIGPPPADNTAGVSANVALFNGGSDWMNVQLIYAVVGDAADTPKNAKRAQLNARGDVTATRDFPSGWLPLMAAKAPVQAMPPGVTTVNPAAIVRPRGTAFYDAVSRTLFV